MAVDLLVDIADIIAEPVAGSVSIRPAGGATLYRTDGQIIAAVNATETLGTGGTPTTVLFPDVPTSDDATLRDDSHGYALEVTAHLKRAKRRHGNVTPTTLRWIVLVEGSGTVELSALAQVEELPRPWVTVSELVADFDARLDALENSPGAGVPIFTTQTEAQAHEAAHPGSVALWFDDGLTSVSTVAPTFTDMDGTSSDSYVIPAVTGVDYKVAGSVVAAGTYPGSGTVTITASPQPGYSLTGTTSWSHTFGTGTAPTPVTPDGPTWTDDNTNGGGTWTTPTQTGVTYSPASGTATPSQSVTVTATAQSGYILQGTTSWTHVFPAAPSLSVLLADDFERADTTAGGTLGTATVGGTWTDSGSAWRISSGRAVTTANTTTPAVLGPSITMPTEYEAKVSFSNITANQSNSTILKVRYSEESSPYYRVSVDYAGKVTVVGWNGAAVVSIGSAWETPALSPAPVVDEVITVRMTVTPEGADNRLHLYINGTAAGDRLDTTLKPTGKSIAMHNLAWSFPKWNEVVVSG